MQQLNSDEHFSSEDSECSQKIDCCQICVQKSDEDYFMICEQLLTPISSNFKKQENTKNTLVQELNVIFQNLWFKKTLEVLFKPKYQEINQHCRHSTIIENIISIVQGTSFAQNRDAELKKLFFHLKANNEVFKDLKLKFNQLNLSIFGDQYVAELGEIKNEKFSNKEIKFNKNSNKNCQQMKAIEILQKWFLDNIENPYPGKLDKKKLSQKTKMNIKQIQNWFTNCRKRYLDPLKKKKAKKINYQQKLSKKRIQNEFESDALSYMNNIHKERKLSLISSLEQLPQNNLVDSYEERHCDHIQPEKLDKEVQTDGYQMNIANISDQENDDHKNVNIQETQQLIEIIRMQQLNFNQQIQQLHIQQQQEQQLRQFYQHQLAQHNFQQQQQSLIWQSMNCQQHKNIIETTTKNCYHQQFYQVRPQLQDLKIEESRKE